VALPAGKLPGGTNMTLWQCRMGDGHCLIIRFVLNLDDLAVAAGPSVGPSCWRGIFDELMLRVGARFGRVEPRRRARAFVLGLLAGLPPVQRHQAGQAAISFQVMENGEPGFGRPSWMPSDHVLPAIVPIGQFLIRTQQMIVALSHLSVYPNGCMLDVRASAHGHDVFERMMFTAQFGAEITAVMHDKTAPRWRPDGKPALLLMQYGQEGDRAVPSPEDRRVDSTLRLWLYPLPPPEPGTLSIVSPDLDPGPASCPLDGRAIVAAAAEAQPYWR